MMTEFASALAQVRPTETWSVFSIAAGVVLFAVAVAALVAWTVHVVTRR